MDNIVSVKGRTLSEGQQVEVYYNLHKKCFSIRCKASGLVVAHAAAVTLKHVAFKVSEAGRQRVIKEQRKNVHALITGVYTAQTAPDNLRPLYYNPYKVKGFTDAQDGKNVIGAAWVRCEGKQARYI